MRDQYPILPPPNTSLSPLAQIVLTHRLSPKCARISQLCPSRFCTSSGLASSSPARQVPKSKSPCCARTQDTPPPQLACSDQRCTHAQEYTFFLLTIQSITSLHVLAEEQAAVAFSVLELNFLQPTSLTLENQLTIFRPVRSHHVAAATTEVDAEHCQNFSALCFWFTLLVSFSRHQLMQSQFA